MRAFFKALLCFFFISSSQAQDFIDTWYDDDSGLLQNSIKDIAKDNDGFIWFATESGLVRFNGKRFKVFSSIQGLKTQRMDHFYRKNDTLFAATSQNESVFIKNLNPQFYSSIEDNLEIEFSEISKKTFVFEKIIEQEDVNLLYHKLANRLVYVASTAQNFYLINKNKRILQEFPKQKFKGLLASLVVDEDWFLILNTKILKFNFDLLQFEDAYKTATSKIKNVYYNKAHDQVFIALHSQIFIFSNKETGLQLDKVHANFNVTNKFTTCLYKDETYNTLYSGSWAYGLGISKPSKFTTIQLKEDRSKNLIYAFNWNQKDSIFLPNGLIIHDQKIIKTDAISHNLLINQYFPRDQNDNFYAAKRRKIMKLRYNAESLKYKEDLFLDFKEDLGVLYVSKENELYISTKSFNNSNQVYFFKTNNLNEANTKLDTLFKFEHEIYYINESLDGSKLWIGTNNGLFIYKPTSNKIDSIPGLNNTVVRTIKETKKYVWIGSYNNGYFHYSKADKKLTKLPYDNSNYLKTVHHIVEDDYNNIWLPTNKGLFKANKDEVLAYIDGKKGYINYYYFNTQDGLAINEFNGGCYPCEYLDKNNNIIFPSLNGLVKFNPKDFLDYKLANEEIFIDEIILDGKSYLPATYFKIPKNFKNLEIHVDALAFNKLPTINFTSPLNTNLSKYSSISDGKLVFTSLPHGKHQLNFSLGTSNKAIITSMQLEKEMFWHETKLFKVSLIMFIGLLVVFVIFVIINHEKNKSNQLQRIIDEKTRQLQSTIQDLRKSQKYFENQLENQKKIVASISHDIKSPLQYLAYGIEYLEQGLKDKKLEKDVYENIEALSSSIEKLKEFTQNILDFSKAIIQTDANLIETSNIRKLVDEKVGLFEQMAKQKKNLLEIKSKEDVYFSLNRNYFSVILHNILDNAIKNTFNGTIEVKLQKLGNNLILKIKDTGAGMSMETLERYRKVFDNSDNEKINVSGSGLGLHIVSETAKLMNAKIEINSEKGKGTEFYMLLPHKIK